MQKQCVYDDVNKASSKVVLEFIVKKFSNKKNLIVKIDII